MSKALICMLSPYLSLETATVVIPEVSLETPRTLLFLLRIPYNYPLNSSDQDHARRVDMGVSTSRLAASGNYCKRLDCPFPTEAGQETALVIYLCLLFEYLRMLSVTISSGCLPS